MVNWIYKDLGSSFWQHLADRCWLCEICTVQVRRGRGPGEKQNAAVLWQQLDQFDIFSMGFSIMTYYNPLHLNMFAANPIFDRAGSQLIATWSRMKISMEAKKPFNIFVQRGWGHLIPYEEKWKLINHSTYLFRRGRGDLIDWKRSGSQ